MLRENLCIINLKKILKRKTPIVCIFFYIFYFFYLQGSYLETIHPIDAVRNLKKRPEIGQRVRLSEGDIAQTKLLYKCNRK